jgi:hypothetical protein
MHPISSGTMFSQMPNDWARGTKLEKYSFYALSTLGVSDQWTVPLVLLRNHTDTGRMAMDIRKLMLQGGFSCTYKWNSTCLSDIKSYWWILSEGLAL